MRRVLQLAILALLAIGLSACQYILPVEPRLERQPVAPTRLGREHASWPVTRADLRLEQTVRFRYKPVREIDLRFPVTGLFYDEILVKKGDLVDEGQLLATLQSGDLAAQIAESDTQLERLDIVRGQLLARQARERSRLERLLAARGEAAEETRRQLGEQAEAHEAAVEHIDREIELLRLTRETQGRRLDERRLVAPFAGIVTYTRRISDGDRSSTFDQVVHVSDNTRSLFLTTTEYVDYFAPGKQFEIQLDDMAYPVTAVDPADYGMEVDAQTAALSPDIDELVLETDQSGTVILLLESREQVLVVPERAVFAAGDGHYVYLERSDDVREARPVTVGLRANGQVEITEGLSEGEVVIID